MESGLVLRHCKTLKTKSKCRLSNSGLQIKLQKTNMTHLNFRLFIVIHDESWIIRRSLLCIHSSVNKIANKSTYMALTLSAWELDTVSTSACINSSTYKVTNYVTNATFRSRVIHMEAVPDNLPSLTLFTLKYFSETFDK